MPAPDLAAARRVLAVQPHYDDNDIGAGGTLAALADAGAELRYLTVTDDLVGVLDTEIDDAEARARLRAEQERAGAEIGVTSHVWLDHPDAGDWSAFQLRFELIREMRRFAPDLLISCDPWLPHESHPDHLKTGRAVAEAALLHGFPRLRTDPETDAAWKPQPLRAVAFYFTREPNQVFDVGSTRERKDRALACYQAQFAPEALRALRRRVEARERRAAEGHDFLHGEPLKVLAPEALHCAVGATR